MKEVSSKTLHDSNPMDKEKWLTATKKYEHIYHASVNADIDAVKGFLLLGANPNYRPYQGRSLLCEVAHRGSVELAEVLISAGADVNSGCDKHLDSLPAPLHYAVRQNHIEMVKYLISKGADLSPRDRYMFGNTPLHDALFHNHKEMVKILVEAGVDVNFYSPHGAPPIQKSRDAEMIAYMRQQEQDNSTSPD